MGWSFYQSKLFSQCQRKWFLKTTFANANATKNPLRREAYLLSKLSSVYAWRGRIVDFIISKYVVPIVQRRGMLDLELVVRKADDLLDRQLNFATIHRLHDPNFMAFKDDDDFTALWDVEYNGKVSASKIEQARNDVRLALTNLMAMRPLIEMIQNAYLIPQRRLRFRIDGISTSIISYPDLIAFFDNEPPLIIDWKVHAFGRIDYRLQLACYALGLILTHPHKDFPSSISYYELTDIRLLEVQLLTNQQREYQLSEEDIENTEDYIAATTLDMEMALITVDGKPLEPRDFPVTSFPQACQNCQFQKICWELELWYKEPQREPRQMSLL